MVKVSMNTVGKAVIFTAVALVVLGLVKTAAPDIWNKIPGLKEF